MKKSNVTQVTTFEKLLGFCNAQGAMYNPPKDSLKVTALNSLLTSAQQSVQAVNALTIAYNKAVGERSQAFNQLPKMMTRLLNAVKAANASETTINEVTRFKKRFTVRIKSRPKQSATTDAANGDPPVMKTRMQAAYDHQVENFHLMIKAIASDPAYATIDPTLTLDGLGKHEESLREKNKAVRDAWASLSAARKQRDRMLYSKEGIFTVSKTVKNYFLSILGTQNASAREIISLRFFGKKDATA